MVVDGWCIKIGAAVIIDFFYGMMTALPKSWSPGDSHSHHSPSTVRVATGHCLQTMAYALLRIAQRGSATANIRCGCATGSFLAPGNTVASSLPSLFSGSAWKTSMGLGTQIRAIKTKSSAKKRFLKRKSGSIKRWQAGRRHLNYNQRRKKLLKSLKSLPLKTQDKKSIRKLLQCKVA